LSFAEAAAAPLTLLTASMFFRQSKATRGQRVFINGASGGVGLLAVQLAKVKGLYVVASCSERTRAFVESLKPDEIVDYQKTPLEQYLPQTYPAGTDKALDYVFDVCAGILRLLFC
jgi:NADPH2:quinone reductase